MNGLKKSFAFEERDDNYTNVQKEDHEKARLKFQEANLSDDILFGMVMHNDNFAKIVIGIVLGKKVMEIKRKDIQKSLPNLPGYKSVRLDVIVMLEDGTLCNVEMQTVNNDSMPKRSRFYQGILDVVTLYSGKTVKYKKLPNTVIVFITEFDPFGEGLYKYTFTNRCKESSNLELGDGCTKIFLNTQGEFGESESKDLIDFLKFVHESSKENASVNDELFQLYKIIQEFKGDSEKERDYMNMEALKDDYLEEGEQIGKQKLTKLLRILEDSGRSNELSKVIRDEEYQEKLMKEFNL